MKFEEISDIEEYEEFVKKSNKSHFMQSYYWGEVAKSKNFIPHTVVLKENDNIIASALILEKKLLSKYSYFYIPRGFILDYSNFDLIKTFTNYLKEYAKKKNAIYIKIDPDIKLHDLDLDGKVIGDKDNFPLFRYLNSIGYKHMGFFKSFVGMHGEQPRYTFRLNLDRNWDDIYNGMHPTTRKILNKGNQYNLDMYIGDINDIDKFYTTMLETADREGNMIVLPIEYFKNFYEILNKHNMSDLYIVKVKIKDLITTSENKIKEIENSIKVTEELINQKKKENLLNDLNLKLKKAKEELEEIKKIDKEEIILSSIITAKYGDKVWTIHGGNSTLLRELNSNYLLYLKIIKDAYDQHYKTIDFFGCSGEANPDKSNPTFGVHNFKKRLGGEYTEFIGEFDLITNKFMYFVYKRLIPIYRKIKKH